MANKIDFSGGKQQLRPQGINNTKNALKAHSRSYPDAATRIIGADVIIDDIGTLALQEDNNSLWLLVGVGPVVWEAVGSPEYTNATPMPATVGGWEAGSTFTNVLFPDLITGLLYPYQYPAFSSFVMAGQATPIEVGAALLTNPTFSWGATNSSNVASNSIGILDVTGSVTLVSGIANDGFEAVTLAAITKSAAASHIFRISGINTHADSFTRDVTYLWQWKRYYGTSVATSLDEAAIKGLLNASLSSGFAGSYSFAAGGYKYLGYAAALGTATSFKDSLTLLDVAMEAPVTVSVTNVNGITTNYNVHRTTNVIGSMITIVVS